MINNTSQRAGPDIVAANELAPHLAAAENSLRTFTEDQVDAIMDGDGRTYLLRPAQERLRESERRLEAVIQSAADVITVVPMPGTP